MNKLSFVNLFVIVTIIGVLIVPNIPTKSDSNYYGSQEFTVRLTKLYYIKRYHHHDNDPLRVKIHFYSQSENGKWQSLGSYSYNGLQHSGDAYEPYNGKLIGTNKGWYGSKYSTTEDDGNSTIKFNIYVGFDTGLMWYMNGHYSMNLYYSLYIPKTYNFVHNLIIDDGNFQTEFSITVIN